MGTRKVERADICKIEVENAGGNLLLRFRGQITDNAELADLLKDPAELSGVKSIAIDVGGIDRINSRGVRTWILFIERLEAKAPLRFSCVGEVFIEQAVTAPKILGKRGTRVDAFEVPYACAGCKTRSLETVRMDSINFKGMKFTPPAAKCPRCGHPAHFDAVEEEYQAFLKHTIT